MPRTLAPEQKEAERELIDSYFALREAEREHNFLMERALSLGLGVNAVASFAPISNMTIRRRREQGLHLVGDGAPPS